MFYVLKKERRSIRDEKFFCDSYFNTSIHITTFKKHLVIAKHIVKKF